MPEWGDSCLYEGVVRHRRRFPAFNQFDFKLFMFLLDVDHVSSAFDGNLLFSAKRRALARFRESEHLVRFAGQGDLRTRVELALKESGHDDAPAKILLLTQLRYFGFSMKPISLFYCYDESDNLTSVVAEVNNTPWGEQHIYVVKGCRHADGPGDSVSADRIEKSFHVSPFMSLDMFYQMKFSRPGEKLAIRIENHLTEENELFLDHENDSDTSQSVSKRGNRILEVSMTMRRIEFSTSNLNWYLLKYPLISVKTFAGIYWQAFRLYFLKKLKFFPHPRKLPTESRRLCEAIAVDEIETKSASQVAAKEMLIGR